FCQRALVKTGEWAPWEMGTVVITGDHMVPVIWNRRLYIFWPIFTQKANPPTQQPTNTTPITQASVGDLQSAAIPPQKYWEISLAWSEYKQNKWSPKQLAKQVLELDPEPFSNFDQSNDQYDRYPYVFRTYVSEDASGDVGDLLIHCHMSRSVALPQVPFDDLVTLGTFTIGGCTGETIRVHKYSGIGFGGHGFPVFNDGKPIGADFDAMTFAEHQDPGAENTNPELAMLKMTGRDGQQVFTFLKHTPTRYRLLYPHQYQPYTLQAPFFYQDAERTFFVSTSQRDIPKLLNNPNALEVTSYVNSVNGVVRPPTSDVARAAAMLPATSTQPAGAVTAMGTMALTASSDWAAMVSESSYNWPLKVGGTGGGGM